MDKDKGTSFNKKLEHWQIVALCLMVCDVISIHLSYFLALWLRFDCVYSHIPKQYLLSYIFFIFPYAICSVILFWFFRMYRGMWRYASYNELLRTFAGSMTAAVLHAVLITAFFVRMPLSYYIWGGGTQLVLLLIPRFSFRLLLFYRSVRAKQDETAGRVMIIGAGQAGQLLLRDIQTSEAMHDRVVCIIDDNPNKWNRYHRGRAHRRRTRRHPERRGEIPRHQNLPGHPLRVR